MILINGISIRLKILWLGWIEVIIPGFWDSLLRNIWMLVKIWVGLKILILAIRLCFSFSIGLIKIKCNFQGGWIFILRICSSRIGIQTKRVVKKGKRIWIILVFCLNFWRKRIIFRNNLEEHQLWESFMIQKKEVKICRMLLSHKWQINVVLIGLSN